MTTIQPIALDREALAAAGEALYGERWQTDIAKALGISDSRRIRAILSGDRPIPPRIWKDIAVLLRERAVAALEVARRIEQATDCRAV